MMKEIRTKGPIVADIVVPLGFSIYKSGIFSDIIHDYDKFSDQTTKDNCSEN